MAAAISALRAVNSWAGRTHIHKHLFITQVLGLADIPFKFQLYQYGPYSFDLDNTIAEMEAYGWIDKNYPRPGYGPQYFLLKRSEKLPQRLQKNDYATVQRVAAAVGGEDTKSLELIATCLWVQERENLDSDADIVITVRRVKPKYSAKEIRSALKRARGLIEQLASAA